MFWMCLEAKAVKVESPRNLVSRPPPHLPSEAGEPLSINRMLEELGGIRETLVAYPRRQGQRQAPTATCLTRMTALQQRLFSLLGLQRFVPASR
jgi:hypothetical protein